MTASTFDNSNYRKCLQDKMSNFVFRRVGSYKEHSQTNWFKHQYNKNMERVSKSTDDNVVGYSTNFSVMTLPQKLRSNDRYNSMPITCHSSVYEEFDILKREWAKRSLLALPKRHELLCIDVGRARDGSLVAARWFMCSEQFLRAWTLIMFDTHETFDKKIKNGDETVLKRWILSGNRLNTNSYLKWINAHKQSCKKIDLREQKKRYHPIKTEHLSERYVHVYSAVVLMARYGEIPNNQNVPRNNDDSGIYCRKWSLPDNIENLVAEFSRTPAVTQSPLVTLSDFPALTPSSVTVGVKVGNQSWSEIVKIEIPHSIPPSIPSTPPSTPLEKSEEIYIEGDSDNESCRDESYFDEWDDEYSW